MGLLFKPAEITTAKLKMGLTGMQGSGKTYTATLVAIGLVKLMRELRMPEGNKPIFFLDTEKGSDWIVPRVREAGIEINTAKTRAFTDLVAAFTEAEAMASVLLIDSLTHFWNEFIAAYLRVKKRNRLQFEDFNYVKGPEGWQRFTDRYINSNVHTIFAGRAGWEYENEVNEDTGKREIYKSGIKMRAEGETGYEPDLFVLMERRMNMQTHVNEHVAIVQKDRSTLLDGAEIANPTFESFLPHIRCLNITGQQFAVDTSRTSDRSIPPDGQDKKRQREIILDEIKSLLILHYPADTGKDRQRKIELLRSHFKAAWTEIEKVMPLFDLRAGYETLHQELEGKPSKYAGVPITQKVPLAEPIPDALPDHSAPPKSNGNGAARDHNSWIAEFVGE